MSTRIREDRSLPNCDDHRVSIRMSRDEAVALFHSINRTLAILDDARANEDDGLVEDLEPGDQAAYDMASAFIEQLERELQIPPETAH